MKAEDAYAIEVYRTRRFRLNVDEIVAAIGAVALASALFAGILSERPQVVSCYQQSPGRE